MSHDLTVEPGVAGVGDHRDGYAIRCTCGWWSNSHPTPDSAWDHGNAHKGEAEAKERKEAEDDSDTPTARALLAMLLEHLSSAIDETRKKSERPWEAGAAAARWLEMEIAPVLERYQARFIDAAGHRSEPFPCPCCHEGEARIAPMVATMPLQVRFEPCGHEVRFSPSYSTDVERHVLPMSSDELRIMPGQTAQITSRPSRGTFRPERLIIGGHAARWTVVDIRIGNRSQFAQAGVLPGDLFGTQAIDSFVNFETAQTAMDIVLVVRYDGDVEEGEAFRGSFIGSVPRERRPGQPMTAADRAALIQGWQDIINTDERTVAPNTPEARSLLARARAQPRPMEWRCEQCDFVRADDGTDNEILDEGECPQCHGDTLYVIAADALTSPTTPRPPRLNSRNVHVPSANATCQIDGHTRQGMDCSPICTRCGEIVDEWAGLTATSPTSDEDSPGAP